MNKTPSLQELNLCITDVTRILHPIFSVLTVLKISNYNCNWFIDLELRNKLYGSTADDKKDIFWSTKKYDLDPNGRLLLKPIDLRVFLSKYPEKENMRFHVSNRGLLLINDYNCNCRVFNSETPIGELYKKWSLQNKTLVDESSFLPYINKMKRKE